MFSFFATHHLYMKRNATKRYTPPSPKIAGGSIIHFIRVHQFCLGEEIRHRLYKSPPLRREREREEMFVRPCPPRQYHPRPSPPPLSSPTLGTIPSIIERRYPNRIVIDIDVGPVICRPYGPPLKVEDGILVSDDGGSRHRVIFRCLVFRPIVEGVDRGESSSAVTGGRRDRERRRILRSRCSYRRIGCSNRVRARNHRLVRLGLGRWMKRKVATLESLPTPPSGFSSARVLIGRRVGRMGILRGHVCSGVLFGLSRTAAASGGPIARTVAMLCDTPCRAVLTARGVAPKLCSSCWTPH